MQGFHMQICSLIIPWQMEYVGVYSLHNNKLVLETYNEDPLMVSRWQII